MNIELIKYQNEKDYACYLIKQFWISHNDFKQTLKESEKDLKNWTKRGHIFYFIKKDNNLIGFIHLGNRGAKIDWLEDIFVLPEYQGKGIGTKAISLIEEIVKEYSESLYIEAAARNIKAIHLYQKMGYNCLNTITIRKDFEPANFETISNEKISNLEFEIKKYKK